MKRCTRSVLQRRAELARTDSGHQHAEGEDPTRGAVAVGERQTGLVERLHHTGLPRDADSAARQHERTLWFVGHRSYASVIRTATISAGGGGVERGERKALLAESLRANAADRPRSRHRSWPPSPSATPFARRPCRCELVREGASVDEQAAGHGHEHADDPEQEWCWFGPSGTQDAQHRPGCRDQRPARTRRSPHRSRSRPSCSVIRLGFELRIRASRRRRVIARPRRLSRAALPAAPPPAASRPAAEGGSSHSVLFGRPNTESRSSPPHRSLGSTASAT